MFIKKIGAFIDRFFFSAYDSRPLAVFRIALGTLMLIWCLLALPNLDRDYAADGMLSLHQVGPQVDVLKWYSVIDMLDGKVPLLAFWIALLIASLFFLFGFLTRASTVALFVLHTGFLHRNLWASNAEQDMFRMLLFYAMVMPLGDGFSIDRLLFKKPKSAAPIWPVRAAQIHLCLVYLISSPYKWFSDEAWRTGDALYYVMINPNWSRWPWPSMFYHWPVTALASYASLLLEFSTPFLIWGRFRPWVALTMIVFQILLGLVLNHISFFTFTMACGLTLFFVPAFEWRNRCTPGAPKVFSRAANCLASLFKTPGKTGMFKAAVSAKNRS